MEQPTLEMVEHGLRGNPLHDLVEGWTFHIDEVSSNVYRIVGWDSKANHVVSMGSDPLRVLEKCIEQARRMDEPKTIPAYLKSMFKKIFGGED